MMITPVGSNLHMALHKKENVFIQTMTCFVYTTQSILNWKQENKEFVLDVEG